MPNLPATATWWLTASMANLSLACLLVVAWWAGSRWFRVKQQSLVIGAGAAALLGLLGSSITYRNPLPAGLLVLGIGGSMLILLAWYQRHDKPSLQRLFKVTTLSTLSIALLVPTTLVLSGQDGSHLTEATLDTRLQNARQDILNQITHTKEVGEELLKDETFQENWKKRDLPIIHSQLQQRLVSAELHFLTLTDGMGNVLVRATERNRTGDNLYELLPWTAPAYRNELVAGIGYGEQGLPVIGAALPLSESGMITAVLTLGTTLNERFTNQHAGIAVGSRNGLTAFTPATDEEGPLYRAPAFSEYLRQSSREQGVYGSVTTSPPQLELEKKRYLVQSLALPTLLPEQPVSLASLSHLR